MSPEDITVFLILLSRLPLYGFAFWTAWRYRRSTILISADWLGALALAAIVAATSSTFASAIIRALTGYLFAVCLFMLALTANELNGRKR